MVYGFSLISQFWLMLTLGGAAARAPAPSLHFSVEVHRSEYVVGVPILAKLTLNNGGPRDYRLRGAVGWGRQLQVAHTDDTETGEFLPPDITQFEGIYSPPYYFIGTIPPRASQYLVHMINTTRMKPGRLNLKALMRLNRETLWTPEATVRLMGRPKDGGGRESSCLSPDEQAFICKYVPRRHNRFYRGRKDTPGLAQHRAELSRIVSKAMASHESSLACEYAIYSGVLQCIHVVATDDDIKLADEAAEVLAKRFPDSWLRAYAYGMLATVHFEKGNSEKARAFAEKGLKLPESKPLFHNLGIMDRLEKLKPASRREEANSSQETNIR